jgi:hypothetical protein
MHTDTRTLEEKIADRDAKLEVLHDKLYVAVGELVSGDDWKRALDFAAKFRARSFNNTLLIYLQFFQAQSAGIISAPAPTYVAGFKQWQSLRRSVMRGMSGFQIFAPVNARMASPDPESSPWRRLARGEKPEPGEVVRSKIVGVRPAYVWDVSQTTGEPIPERPALQMPTGQAPAGLWDGLADHVSHLGYDLQDVPDADALGGSSGRTTFSEKRVQVRADMDDASRVMVLTHELGHVMLHAPGRDASPDDGVAHDPGTSPHRGIREVEADSVAYMVSAAHGLDTSGSTIPYVSGWASSVPGTSPAEVVLATAGRVRTTALSILDRLDTQQISDGDPPGLDRSVRPRRDAPKQGVAARDKVPATPDYSGRRRARPANERVGL